MDNSSNAELRQARMHDKVTYTPGSRARQSNVQCRTLRTCFVVNACSAIDVRAQPCRDDDHQAVHLHSFGTIVAFVSLAVVCPDDDHQAVHLHSFGTIVAFVSLAFAWDDCCICFTCIRLGRLSHLFVH